MTIDNIKEEINKSKKIVILTHENPDGDAIGSSLALYLALKKLNKDVDLIIPKFSRIFNFLPAANEIKKESNENYDLAIAIDCATKKRLVGYEEYFENSKSNISIDHHGSNEMFSDYNFINPDAPACAQILIFIIKLLGIEIDIEIGTCLLTGIITDTGGFQYEGVSAETFEFASFLLSIGVNVSNIYKKVLNMKTKANFELTKLIVDRMEFIENGKISYTYMTLEDVKNVGAEEGDHEGLVEIGRDIEGIEVSIFIRETEKGYKVSLRSNYYVNVSDICLMFGGGGHPRAAGCIIQAPLEHVKQKIINQIKLHLK